MTSTPYATSNTLDQYKGFYGTTPIVQPSGAAQAATTATMVTALATTVFSEAKTGMWAFSSSTVAKLYRTRINQAVVDVVALATECNAIRTALVNLGLIKGSA